jgi:hypothetical protein
LLRIAGWVPPGHVEGKEHTESIPVLSDPNHPSEAKIHLFEALWLTSGPVMLLGTGLSLLFTDLFISVLR